MTNLDPIVSQAAFSSAAISAAGSLKALEGNSQLKPVNAGNAASTAITALAVADAGYLGPEDVLGGDAGFLAMMSDSCDTDKLLGQVGLPLAVERVYLKPHAACRYCHPAIDAALDLRSQHQLDTHSVARIQVETYELAVRHHDHTTVENSASAKMSIPYGVAVALQYGAVGISEFSDEHIRSDAVRRLMSRTLVSADEGYSRAFPHQTSARLTITLNNGRTLIGEVNQPKGDPQNPLSDDDVRNKFINLTLSSHFPEARAHKIYDAVMQLPNSPNLLYELL